MQVTITQYLVSRSGARLRAETRFSKLWCFEMNNLRSTAGDLNQGVELVDLEQGIGAMIRIWSTFERELNRAIVDLGAETGAKPVSQRLERWRDLHIEAAIGRPDHREFVMEVSEILKCCLVARNEIAHGTVNFRTSRADETEDGYIITEINGAPRKHTLTEIRSYTGQLVCVGSHFDRIRRAIQLLDQEASANIYKSIRRRLSELRGN